MSESAAPEEQRDLRGGGCQSKETKGDAVQPQQNEKLS